MELTPRLLEQLVVLAEERHFGRAAARLHMTQPPLSQAMARLEQGLGVALLAHSTRGMELTAAGEVFARDARRLLESQHAVVERVRRIGRGEAGTLTVGFVASLASWYLPRLIATAAQELPGVRLDLHRDGSAALVEAVRVGRLDLALVRSPVLDAEDLLFSEVTVERLAVALPAEHRLAGGGGPTPSTSLALSELAEEPFVLPSPVTMPGLHAQVLAACQAAGFTPRAAAVADDLTGMLAAMMSGRCVGIVPDDSASLPSRLVLRSPSDPLPELTSRILAVRGPGADPALGRLLEVIDGLAEERLRTTPGALLPAAPEAGGGGASSRSS